MNSRQLNLVLVGINIGLLGVIVAMLAWIRKPGGGSPSASRTEYVENTVTQIAVRKFNATNLLSELTKLSLGWSALESTNYLLYINNLRRFGCPEQTIRDIIITDVGKLYGRRMREALSEARPFEYWRTLAEGQTEALNPALEEELTRLATERDRLVRDLLGVEFDAEMARYEGVIDARERTLAFLAEDKRQRVMGILDSFDQLEQEILDRAKGAMLPADEAQLRLLDQQREAELAKVLTAEEMALYELNVSPLATELRYELNGFAPSPGEFQAIFNLRKGFNGILDSMLMDEQVNPATREQAIQDAEATLEAELRKTLGEDRYAQLEQARDPDYRFLLDWTERYQVAPDMAQRIYDMKRSAEAQRQRVEDDLDLSFEQRQLAYQAIAQETKRSLTQLLGQDTYSAYHNAGGQWIDSLQESDLAFELLVPEVREAFDPSNPMP